MIYPISVLKIDLIELLKERRRIKSSIIGNRIGKKEDVYLAILKIDKQIKDIDDAIRTLTQLTTVDELHAEFGKTIKKPKEQ